MEIFVVIVIYVLCFICNRTMTAPIIKASGVQWSEPKGTGKGNITLIMIPQNTSCGNDSDMIVAVKSDYQIMSQDTQLLNLVVNENSANKTNASKSDTSLQNCSSLNETFANNKEKEKMLIHPNTAKYFEYENKIASENTTNNTVNIYPLLVKNYQNLVALNGTSTTLSSINTVNVVQLLNMNVSNNKSEISNSVNVSRESHLNTAANTNDSFNLTDPNNHNIIQDNNVKSKNGNVSIVGSDDHFLNEALNILEKLKQDPSYYNKFKSNQIPSTEEIKENGDISLTDSKPKFIKSDDSALASDEGEGLGQEFRNMNHENQDISNLEGNVNENNPTSTCFPFFMSFNSDITTTQLPDLNTPKEMSFEQVPLKGTGSNMSQELNISDNATSLDNNVSFTSKCKPLVPKNGFGETTQTKLTPIQSFISISVGYGVQSNDSSQTLSVKTCKPSTGLNTESTNIIPLTVATGQTQYGFGAPDNFTGVTKGEPNYLQQTLAAAKIAAGSDLNITGSPVSAAVTSIPVSGSDSYLSINQTEHVTLSSSGATLVPPKPEQVNKVSSSAGELNVPNTSENRVVNNSQLNNSVTKTEQNLPPRSTVPLDGSTSQNLPRQNELETKTTECVSNALLQTVSPTVVSQTSTNNVAAGLNSLSAFQTACVTDVNVIQELGLPQAGVGDVPKKITLEPQVSCGTMKNEGSSSTPCPVEGQEAGLNNKDLTLPLVKSSIFLANNNEMPKGRDIPISLNASIDEFSLSDLQGKEDRMHGKVAELYNLNPFLFNAEREPTGAFKNEKPKQKMKYYKSDISEKPTFNFDQMCNPNSNQLLKMNFAGKNVILEKRPSYKSETNNIICNNTLENNKKLTSYEIEPADSDGENLALEHKYTTIKLLDSQKLAANEEENLLTLLNPFYKTTLGVNNEKYQGNVTLMDVPFNNMVYTPTPANIDNPQELGQNKTNVSGDLGRQDNDNMNSQLQNRINLTTNQPYLSQKPQLKPKSRLPGSDCSKPYKSKTNEVKILPDISRTSSNDETVQDKTTRTKDKMSIPADSVQKIVIEIVRNTKKPKNSDVSYRENLKYNNKENVKSIAGKKEIQKSNEITNIKQSFVPFKSAWMPDQTNEKQIVYPLIDSMQNNLHFSNEKIRDSLKHEIYDSDGIQDKNVQTSNENRVFENQSVYEQEGSPTIIKEYNPDDRTATNHDKSVGANILKLLMADKSVVKNK